MKEIITICKIKNKHKGSWEYIKNLELTGLTKHIYFEEIQDHILELKKAKLIILMWDLDPSYFKKFFPLY